MQDTKFVANIEAKTGAKGTYWTVTWDDGKHDNLFNEEWKDLCQDAGENKLAVHYIKEKNEKNYWNIVALSLVKDSLPAPKKPEPPPQAEGEPAIKPEYAPQEIGMNKPSGVEVGRCWNDINQLWIHDKLATLFVGSCFKNLTASSKPSTGTIWRGLPKSLFDCSASF